MRRLLLSLLVLLGVARNASGDDVFQVVPMARIAFTEDTRPEPPREPKWLWTGAISGWRRVAMEPHVLLDGEGEAYLETDGWPGNLVLRLPQPRQVSGRLLVPNADYSGMIALCFKLAPPTDSRSARQRFYWAKERYYNRLAEHALPGTPWFRRQARLARQALPINQRLSDNAVRGTWRLDDTFSLFNGSRAVSENLQLDRELPAARNAPADGTMVDVNILRGISVAEIDWKPRIADLHPEPDPLAALIPADQHALFFASFDALARTSDEIESQGAPFALLADAAAEIAQLKTRYERQLGLSLSALPRLLGPELVGSVAMTGSDPYFVAGTDLALLFETDQPVALKALLLAQVASRTQGEPRVAAIKGEAVGVKYVGFRSPDRRVSSYVAALGKAVVVTNSPAQLERLAAVKAGWSASLASLDEYTFFRDRYRRSDPQETAFLFLSDATIRRWCGPRWRIADSRRTRAMAWLGELAAAQLDGLAHNRPTPPPGTRTKDDNSGSPDPEFWRYQYHNGHWWYWLPSRKWTYWDGSAWRDYDRKSYAAWYRHDAGHPVVPDIDLAAYGTLEFLTPIVELPLERVTKAEAEAYSRWRDGYQRNWNWAFDPIGLRLTIDNRGLAADLTVMPLIASSDYRWMADPSGRAKLPGNPDPHPTLALTAVTLNEKDVLGGLGSSLWLFFDDDKYWTELAAQTSTEAASRCVWEHLDRVPVGLFIGEATREKFRKLLPGDSHGGILSLLFVTTRFDELSYRDQPYAKETPIRSDMEPWGLKPVPLYYLPADDGLLITFNEPLLQRFVDRSLERRAKRDQGEANAGAPEWLGKSLAFRFDRQFLEVLGKARGVDYNTLAQEASWRNLPILNAWHRLYPERDPVEMHERLWRTRLVCPGGGQYVWNDEWQTMESTVYGHPGQPKRGPALPPSLATVLRGEFGVTLEDRGLRARAALEREKP